MGGRGALTPLGERVNYFDDEGEGFVKGEDMPVAQFNPQAAHREVDSDLALAHVETGMKDLDHEQLFIVNHDGYVVSAIDGEKGAVRWTDSALQNADGNIATHNHPRKGAGESGAIGGTFSLADLRSMGTGVKEMRARGDEGTYSIRAEEGADYVKLNTAIRQDRIAIQRRQQMIADQCQNAYEHGRYKDKHEARIDSFNKQMDVIHQWYMDNAHKHGFSYSFTPASERNDVTIQRVYRRTQKEIDRDKHGAFSGEENRKKQVGSGVADVDVGARLIEMGYVRQSDGTYKNPKTGNVQRVQPPASQRQGRPQGYR